MIKILETQYHEEDKKNNRERIEYYESFDGYVDSYKEHSLPPFSLINIIEEKISYEEQSVYCKFEFSCQDDVTITTEHFAIAIQPSLLVRDYLSISG